ncbi:MAG TPA: hypothetical protein PKG98_03100 [Myxococcota bacterium]|nr:hypothetical protein [Myxococcota bacterium]
MKKTAFILAVLTFVSLAAVNAVAQTAAEPQAAAESPAAVESPAAEPVASEPAPAPAEPVTVSDADKAFGRDPKPTIDKFFKKVFAVNFELVSMFQYANDTDFDRSSALDDSYGQSTGMFGTFLKHKLNVTVSDFFRFYYEMEVGMDIWSRNSPDDMLGVQEDGGFSFGLRQRELFGEVAWKKLTFRLGYQRIQDVSGLFLNHWFGAGSFKYGAERGSHIRAFGGQMPDQTFEGWDFSKNSLQNDVYIAGVDGQWVFNPWVKLVAGVYYLGDLSLVDHHTHVGVLSAGVAFEQKNWDATMAVVGQFGTRMNAAADGSDSMIKAWGLVLDGGFDFKHVEMRLSATLMSADDDYDGNDSLAFMWSGKRPGMSMLLSENDTRDVGTNIDERISSRDGAFFNTTAGLAGIDFALYYKPVDYIRLGFVTAALMVLNDDNALGGEFVGSENELVFECTLLHDLLKLNAVGGLIVPGKAGGALLNRIDHTATDNIYFGQLGVVMMF